MEMQDLRRKSTSPMCSVFSVQCSGKKMTRRDLLVSCFPEHRTPNTEHPIATLETTLWRILPLRVHARRGG